jgi:hypothetical protein
LDGLNDWDAALKRLYAVHRALLRAADRVIDAAVSEM